MNLEMSKIITLINEGNFQKAELLIKNLLKSNPNSFDLNKALAISLLGQKRYNPSLIAFNKCYELNKDDYDVNVNLSLIFNKVQDYKNSLFFSENALKKEKNRPEVYHNLADSYLYIPDLEKAEKFILKSIELRGGLNSKEILKYKDTLNIYTDILLSKGDLDKFRSICLNILDTGIYFGDIFRKLLRNKKDLIRESHVSSLKEILDQIDNYGNLLKHKLTKAGIYSCLAEYYNKENQKISEEYYEKSNKLISSVQRDSLFDRQKKIINIKKIFNESNAQYNQNNSNDLGEGIIFIIGMPRSGTTLVESILATAENCVAGGEKVFYHVQCSPIINQYQNSKIDYDKITELGKNYLEVINIQRQGKRNYIDKMPDNFLYYNFIKLSLPKAKFVHIHRNPWDNAISLFKQNFANELFYASSFFGIALEYANYEHLMNIWKKLNNNDIFDVSYEELISNTDKVVQELWEFCDLAGKYDPDKRKRHFAQTASKHQVTKDIYNTSLDKREFISYKDTFYKDLNLQREFWLK